jgi:hypothetical protein
LEDCPKYLIILCILFPQPYNNLALTDSKIESNQWVLFPTHSRWRLIVTYLSNNTAKPFTLVILKTNIMSSSYLLWALPTKLFTLAPFASPGFWAPLAAGVDY